MANVMFKILDGFSLVWVRHSKPAFLQLTLIFELEEMNISSRHSNSNLLTLLTFIAFCCRWFLSSVSYYVNFRFEPWVNLSQWAWFSVSTGNFAGSGPNSTHPLPDDRWIARLAITRNSCVFNSRKHRISPDASVSKRNWRTPKEMWRGNLLWRPSGCHVWRWVIVPPDFFVAKPAK